MISFAGSDMGGSWGKRTGFSTILYLLTTVGSGILGFCLLLIDLNRILMPERRVAGKKLIYEDPQCPPVDGSRVALVVNNFGSQVFGRAAKGISLDRVRVTIPQALGEAEVDQLDMAVLI